MVPAPWLTMDSMMNRNMPALYQILYLGNTLCHIPPPALALESAHSCQLRIASRLPFSVEAVMDLCRIAVLILSLLRVTL